MRRLPPGPRPAFTSCQRPLTHLTVPAPSLAYSLEGNRLSPEGGAALAEGLKGNSTLIELK